MDLIKAKDIYSLFIILDKLKNQQNDLYSLKMAMQYHVLHQVHLDNLSDKITKLLNTGLLDELLIEVQNQIELIEKQIAEL